MAKNPKFEETVVRNQRGEFSDKDKAVTPTVRSTTKLPYEGGEQDYDSLTDERKDALASSNDTPVEVLRRLASDLVLRRKPDRLGSG